MQAIINITRVEFWRGHLWFGGQFDPCCRTLCKMVLRAMKFQQDGSKFRILNCYICHVMSTS